jgi:hypothetical protein
MQRRCEMEGPPWGTCVDPDEAYLRGQAGSLGSGLLGGWSQAAYGGSLDARQGEEGEIRNVIHELVSGDDAPPASGVDEQLSAR